MVTARTPGEHGGWAKHVFYETGDRQMIAFWDLHDEQIGSAWKADHAESLGVPAWVNHVAFEAPTLEDLAAHRKRWQEHGITVLEVDHEWCTSIYASDPNGLMVEFCCTTRAFTDEELAEAARLLTHPSPPLEESPHAKVHKPLGKAGVAA